MRIAFLSTFYPFRGGIAQFNTELYKALQTKHAVNAYNFTTLYPDFLFPGSSQFVLPGENTSQIPSERVLSSINPLTFFKSASQIKKFNPDLVLSAYWMPFFAPSMGTVIKLLNKRYKTISILNNISPHEPRIGDRALNRYFLSQNRGFVVMSDTVKKDLLDIIPNAKYVYHQHPIYSHFGEKIEMTVARQRLNLPLNKKLLLFFGFIRDYKGLDLLIEAVAKLNDEYMLVIAGESYGSFEKYSRQIESLGVENKIALHIRYISEEEVPLFFSCADVCVLPYKSATQSGITSIAYHFDLPLIATDTGGLKETIPPDTTGIIVDFPDAGLIAKAIEFYFSQNLKLKFQEGIKSLKNQLSWNSLAKAIIEFAQSL